jgi:RHS repeat-associated protein
MNGNLALHIPLPVDTPQRGELKIGYYLVVNAKTWKAALDHTSNQNQWSPATVCTIVDIPNTGPCGQGPVFVSTASFGITRQYGEVATMGQGTDYSEGSPSLSTWDGSSHPLLSSNGTVTGAGTYVAGDTSGYRIYISGSDVNGLANNAVVVDREGTQYTGAFQRAQNTCTTSTSFGWPTQDGSTRTVTCTEHFVLSSVTDANGNVLTAPLGVPDIAVPKSNGPSISSHQAVGSEANGCMASFGTPFVSYIDYPGPNGQTNEIKLCFAVYPQLSTSFSPSGIHQFQDNYTNHAFPGSFRQPVYLSNVFLPDGTQWSLNYDSYGEITSVTTPTGAQIQYSWSEGQFPITSEVDLTTVSRAVHTRKLIDVNGNTFTWTYQWGGIAGDGTISHTVTDPSNNDTVHVFKSIDAVQSLYPTNFKEISTINYQGTGGSRIPLKEVDTGWFISTSTYAAVPADITTTVYPSRKSFLQHTDYDSSAPTLGLPISIKTYDWSGSLLKEVDTVYEWQKNSSYLTANFIDLPASTIMVSANAAANVKSNCPIDGAGTTKACMAETDYIYDEASYLTNYEQTVGALPTGSHVSAPNPVRGNQTTVSKWLNTGGPVVSHTNWYDTGEKYQSIDPLSHITQYSYDLAFNGALRTKTCNPKSQCVSGTYDVNSGLLISMTDINGSYAATGTTKGDPAYTTNYGYDLMERLTSVVSPHDPTGVSPYINFNYLSPTTIQRISSITSLADNLTTYLDGLGHIRRAEHLTPLGTAALDSTYDGFGHPTTVSNPYFATTDPTYGNTTDTYDGLGRISQSVKPDGSISSVRYSVKTTVAVNGDCNISTDEAGKARGTCLDALGRLVEVDEPAPSGATPVVNYFARMETNGNFVLYDAASNSLWSTGTAGIANAQTIVMQDDGNLVVYIFKWQAGVYAAPTPGPFPPQSCGTKSYLAAGQSINANQCLVSPHGQYILYMAPDGNFYIYDIAHSTAPWSAGTYGHSGAYATMQTDGNFVVYASNGTALWNSGTAGTSAERLELEDDGRIIIFKSAWNSQTSTGAFNWSQLTHPACDAGTGTGWTGVLGSGSCFVSPNGHFELLLQADGNLVINDLGANPQKTLWSTGTGVSPADPGYAMRTIYAYDALGNLLRIDQMGTSPSDSSQWRSRTFTYDSLSRLLTASNPESGTITYTYDADDELLTKTSPAPNQTLSATQAVSYCYDELHRVTQRDYSVHTYTPPACPITAPVVSYIYDAGTNNKGHLTSMTDQAGTASYSYDVLGRLATETRTFVIGNNAPVQKTLSYEYNLDGSLYKLHYPSGAVVTYTPWNNGSIAVSAPQDAKDTVNNINFVASATYGPDLGLTGLINGSGGTSPITNSFTYNKRFQPITMSASTSSQTVFSIGYDFHAGNGTAGSGSDNGNVYAITNYKDTSHGRDQTFTYDSLNRLITAQNAGTNCAVMTVNNKTEYWGNSYTYDAWGNVLGKTITKCGAEHLTVTADTHNWVHTSPGDYQYDAAGNMTYDATENVSPIFDEENRIKTAAGYGYVYDGDGNRVEKVSPPVNPTGGTLYWYMTPGVVDETDLTGNNPHEYVFFRGVRIARKDSNGLVYYYFSDHLKTASVITDSTGNLKAESDYYPWGGELQIYNNFNNTYKFTGKERDSETGLDYFGARHYSNGLGRFITPDWAAKPVPAPYADFYDPQSLNQYGYVRDLPTTRIDADGHDGTAAAVMDIFVGGASEGAGAGAGVSGGLWTVGSVALPGMIGGGLAYGAINSTAQNYDTVANAQMQDVAATNRLMIAQQVALSQDAQAGALIKEGTDANKAAAAAVDEAIKGIANGKYKNPADVQTHVDKLKEGMKEVAKAIQGVKTAVGQKARDAAKKDLEKATKAVKGHEKDLRQKPKVKVDKSDK